MGPAPYGYANKVTEDGKKYIAPKEPEASPNCGRLLTGSSSQGRSKKYFYYHCILPCKARFHTDRTHDLFAKELTKYIPRPGMTELNTEVISRLYREQNKGQREDIRMIREELDQLSIRQTKARNKLINDELDAADYKIIKAECEQKISQLECKLLNSQNQDTNIEPLLKKAFETLAQLDQLWQESTAERKKMIIGALFPEKIVFDGSGFQTARLNEGARLIYLLNKELDENKNGQKESLSNLSIPVTQDGMFSNQLREDLRTFSRFNGKYPHAYVPIM